MREMWREKIEEFIYLMIFIDMKTKRNSKLNEVVDINGSKVFVENGQVKTVLSEAIQQNGYMTIEELRELLHASVNKQEDMIRNGKNS